MRACSAITKRTEELAAFPVDGLPTEIRDHLTGCPICRRKLAAAWISRQLLDAVATEIELLADFPERVGAAVQVASARVSAEDDPWRLGWRLVPAFGTLAAALLLLYQLGVPPVPNGLFDTNGLTAGERLVLEGPSGEPDMVLEAVLDGDER